MPEDTALCLYRITQEALHNVVKHSGGTAARVELAMEGSELRLASSMTVSALTRRRYVSMARSAWSAWPSERVSCMGGFPSSRMPGKGTRIDVRVPIAAADVGLLQNKKNRSPMNRRPRVLLADDHTMLLDAFRRLLEPRCEIVGTACDGRALLELAANTQPDVIVLDIAMPRLNGIDACAQLRRKMPGVRLVFLTVNEDPDIAAEAIRLGASGYLLKNSASGELFTAIERALAGKTYVTPLVTKGVPLGVFLRRATKPATEKLTTRQREVLQLLAEGRAMKEVADLLAGKHAHRGLSQILRSWSTSA